ncbi:MAG: phosphoribosylformylglycinamidine synthase [Firmicutes bacterium]|nr:phosphoribosylformylglycinamidine synthase [Bacillota bacterium]
MGETVRRIFVKKKNGFDIEGEHLLEDFKEQLDIKGLKNVRVINRYDISGISQNEYEKSKKIIFADPAVDYVYDETIDIDDECRVFAVEYLPGQYDQRADSAAQCVEILTQNERPNVKTSKLFVLEGNLTDNDLKRIKEYHINPIDSKEASLEKPDSLTDDYENPEDVKIVKGFIDMGLDELEKYLKEAGFAMDLEDLKFCQEYFNKTEKRDPTITELKVIDTYWSDHCRHTTFSTKLEDINFKDGYYTKAIMKAYNEYLNSREYVYGEKEKDICLMDIATMGMKELRKKGMLDDLEISDEINAASIIVDVDIEGENEKWLVMFKNETHNHPTEIEPFGGAATCLGGAIRDPLSGRSYVYQAMRVTGSGDPRVSIEDTLEGKLPQRKITKEAAEGYSSYGNQIGLATGHVSEIYDNDYLAKRMEIGAVIAAAPKENVRREKPKKGDLILLVGGRTGRDGCGGATGSSKEHDEESIYKSGAEVQKGNPPTERKIQRLFRNGDLAKLIKKCNDFGAGGVSVAIGELADSLEINLDKVPKKYEGLDGTELAISESQERMAVVIDKNDLYKFKKHCSTENLEATIVAEVTDTNRLIMKWRNKNILDISRDFLNTNGVKKKASISVAEPDKDKNFFKNNIEIKNIEDSWLNTLSDLNVTSQKGLVEMFDSTIGKGTVLMPFGGKYQLTPTEGMVAKIPVLNKETNTCSIMSYGFDPKLSKWSPFHGAMYAVVHSIAKVVSMGGDYKKTRLTLQEYFEKLGDNSIKWGKPFSALLGAFYAQKKLNIPAIGGKDSMSGTFKDLNVPPTLVSFAVNVADARNIISPEFKKIGSNVVVINLERKEDELPDFEILQKNFSKIYKLINEGKILSAHTVGKGGISAAISKMAFGNKIGMKFKDIEVNKLFEENYGSVVVEIEENEDITKLLSDINYTQLGNTEDEKIIKIKDTKIDLEKAIKYFEEPLSEVFPIKESIDKEIKDVKYTKGNKVKSSITIAKPRVLIPTFPGTNCEYDTATAFKKAKAETETLIFKNLTTNDIKESIDVFAEKINKSQIIALPGGFSAGDEPDGSGKFIAAVFRNPKIKEAVMNLLNNRDGLIIGICNGFQTLVKLGLVPYGEIIEPNENQPTLTFNKIGRHVSSMVKTKVTSNLSPWFNNVKVGEVFDIAVSHGEGRFVANEKDLKKMIDNGQIATQYVDYDNRASYDGKFNPNGSLLAIEGITSPDGRILGKMGHSERIGKDICKNVVGKKDQLIFEAGVKYFK